jgi:hypothetical protein
MEDFFRMINEFEAEETTTERKAVLAWALFRLMVQEDNTARKQGKQLTDLQIERVLVYVKFLLQEGATLRDVADDILGVE